MIRNVIVVSDLHCGCKLGLCPDDGVALDDGGLYHPSDLQRQVWAWWQEFWGEWVPHVTHREPFAVVVNGDAIEGSHHKATTPISQNLEDQRTVARRVLVPLRDACEGRLYMVRGTEAHGGSSDVDEETIAREVGAIPNAAGQFSRWDLWLSLGDRLIHFLHHIGTTGSNAYEATAVNKEMTEEYNEAARWGQRRPDCIVRSHRHRAFKIEIPTDRGFGIAVVTPGWQLKTPFTWKIPGARLAAPQFGGWLIRLGDEDLYAREQVWTIPRSETEFL